MLLLVIFVLIVVALIVKLYKNKFGYWKRRNIPYRLSWNDWINMLTRKKSLYDIFLDQYSSFPDERYYGMFQFASPMLLVRNLDLIKRITIKDFDHFTDHRIISDPHVDVLMSKNLIALQGQQWKDMRNLLSPAFTGSKMRAMFPLMADCAEKVTEYFNRKPDIQHEIDLKDLFTRYTNDVIATCAFGFNCDSLKDPENEFYTAGKNALNFTGLRVVVMILAQMSPALIKLLKLRIFPKETCDFLLRVIQETIAYRTENGLIRPDMVHLLMEARKGQLTHETEVDTDKSFAVVDESDVGKKFAKTNWEITDIDIAAQGFIFFVAGFETASTMLCFMATELGLNPDVQQKLIDEVDEVLEHCNGKPTYEAIMNMKYLDMVVAETLRKWPPAAATDRVCTKDCTIEASSSESQSLKIKTGDLVMVPILGIHRDAQYYPEPERFDPERFAEENRHNINPDAYLPFGVGPRACIGSRFALLEIKVLFVHLLTKFEFVPIKKTVVPLRLTLKGFKIEPEGGFWLGLKKRFPDN